MRRTPHYALGITVGVLCVATKTTMYREIGGFTSFFAIWYVVSCEANIVEDWAFYPLGV